MKKLTIRKIRVTLSKYNNMLARNTEAIDLILKYLEQKEKEYQDDGR